MSRKLLELAGYRLRLVKQEEMLYEIILDGCSSKTTNDCNRLLMENSLDPLVKEY